MSESLRLALDPSRHEETAPFWEESTLCCCEKSSLFSTTTRSPFVQILSPNDDQDGASESWESGSNATGWDGAGESWESGSNATGLDGAGESWESGSNATGWDRVGESCSGGGMCAPGGWWCVSSMRGRPASCEVDARQPSTDAEIDALKASRQRSDKRAAFCNAAARRQALAGGGDKKESLEREQWQVRCAMGLSSAAAQGERGREGDEGGRLSPAAKCGGEAVAAEERLLLVREGDAPRLIRALHEHVRRLYASAVSISLRGRGSAGDGFRSLRLGTRPAGGPRDLECVIDDLRRQHSIKLHEPSAADEPRPLARPAASRAPFFVNGAVGQWKARRGAPPATTTSICPPPVPRRAGGAASAPHEGRRRAPSLHSVLLRAAASHIRPADPSDEPAAAAGPPPLQQAQGSPQRSHASPRRQPGGLMGRTAHCNGVVKASAGAPRGARVRFSLQEDRAIREGFAHFQGVSCAIWEDILKRGRAVFHSKRTAVSLKDRARTLKLK